MPKPVDQQEVTCPQQHNGLTCQSILPRRTYSSMGGEIWRIYGTFPNPVPQRARAKSKLGDHLLLPSGFRLLIARDLCAGEAPAHITVDTAAS